MSGEPGAKFAPIAIYQWIVVDVETTNLDFGNPQIEENRLICASGVDNDGIWYDSIDDIIRKLSSGALLIAHHAKFEIGWLRREGYESPAGTTFCTQIGEYVLSGNRRLPLNLDSVASRYGAPPKLSFVKALIGGGVCPSQIPRSSLETYNRGDVETCRWTYLAQIKRLAEEGLLNVAFCRNLITPILQEMEVEGTALDPELVEKEWLRVTQSYDFAKKGLDDFTGGLNENSGKQLREYLYGTLSFDLPRLPSGALFETSGSKPSTSKDAIASLRASTPQQKEFLKLYKAIGSLRKEKETLDKMRECCNNDKGILYGTYNQTVTQTNRLSSSGRKYKLQFHNFPRAFKGLFHAKRPGYKSVEADAPQLEFRVAGELGNDRAILWDVANGKDVHQLSFEIIRPPDRQGAKKYTFRPLYGGNSGSPREKKYYKAFRERYSGIYETQRSWTHEVVRTGRLRTCTGLIFYWPDTRVTESGWITNTTSIFNYPIQMFATADIIPIVLFLVYLAILRTGIRAHIVNTVHDSLVLECHEEDLEALREILVDAFTRAVYNAVFEIYGIEMVVPLGVGIKIGEHWGSGEEIKVENKEKQEAVLRFIKETNNANDDKWDSEGGIRQRVQG